jgi:D-arabinose 1-dehydrogenase-like Zn-dependent alcohol dehydrogenase
MTLSTAQTKTAQVVEIAGAGKPMEFKQRAIKEPAPHHVLLKVQACGVCHSDSFSMDGHFPGLAYPCIPGHEIVGIVTEIGPGATRFKVGDRVGVGWHAGHCGVCNSCRSGDFVTCPKLQTPGINCDGGYAEYAAFPEEVCATVPEALDSLEAAPLMCAGVTTFNAVRHSGARPGDVVAVLGLGGLGHLGVQFANKMGFHTVGIARGDEKGDFAKQLGAHAYINSEKDDVAKKLQDLGGAKVVLATVTSSKAMSPVVNGLGVNGRLVIVGAGFEGLDVSPVQLLGARKTIAGWPSGTGRDSEDCMRFAALTGVRTMIEKYPFSQAKEGYERMMSGKARFRVVLDFSK